VAGRPGRPAAPRRSRPGRAARARLCPAGDPHVRKSAAGICRPPRWETAAICTLLSRVASPEVLQRLRWRNWALPGAPPSTPPPYRRPRRLSAASVPPRQCGGGGADGRRDPRGMPSASGSISPEVVQRLRWRNDGGRAWIHTNTPTSSQGRRRGASRSRYDATVASYEECA